MPVSIWRSGMASTRAWARPWPWAESRVGVDRLLQRLGDIGISESAHGPAGARNYDYVPAYLPRSLQSLHLEFNPHR